MKQRIEDPVGQGPPVEGDLGFQEHAGLQRRLPAVRIDIGAVEDGYCLVNRLFRHDRPGGIRFSQHRVRQFDDAAGVGAEILVRKSVILEPHFLPDMDKARGARRDQQLGLQRCSIGDDFHLQLLRLHGLAKADLAH